MKIKLFCFFCLLSFFQGLSQLEFSQSPIEARDNLNRKRVNTAIAVAVTGYAGFSTALYHAWYKDYPRRGFHFFNDWGEWNQMDKAGHAYASYSQASLGFKGALYAGMTDRQALWTGALCSGIFQTTIELMDGFSTDWGFSVYDMVFNALGNASFVVQELAWGQQKFLIKSSMGIENYGSAPIRALNSDAVTTLENRANILFGSGIPERLLKDYNGQTVWISYNLHSSFPTLPTWLNLSVGYGSSNMHGGFENIWEDDSGNIFDSAASGYPRTRQYYLSPDIDLERIKTSSPVLRTILDILNILKFPAPTIEARSTGELKFHWIFW